MSSNEPEVVREPAPTELSVEQLAERGQVSVRTVRFYIAEGLLPGPASRGRGAAYGEDHVLRLRLIRRLAERRVPLSEMRAALEGLSSEEARALLAEEDHRAAALRLAEQSPSPREFVATLLSQARAARQPTPSLSVPSSETEQAAGHQGGRSLTPPQTDVWQRWELAPGVELHVRADALDRSRSLIDRLLRTAAIFGKGRST